MASLTKRWRKSQCSEHDARVIHKWMTLDVSMRLFLEGATMQGSEWILWGHQKIDPCEGKKAGKTGWGPGTQPFIRTVTPHPFLGKWPAVHVTTPEMRLVLQWHGSQLSLAPAHPVKQEVQVQTVPLLSVGRRLLPLLMFHMRVKDSQKSTRWRREREHSFYHSFYWSATQVFTKAGTDLRTQPRWGIQSSEPPLLLSMLCLLKKLESGKAPGPWNRTCWYRIWVP